MNPLLERLLNTFDKRYQKFKDDRIDDPIPFVKEGKTQDIPGMNHADYGLTLNREEKAAVVAKFMGLVDTRKALIDTLESLRNTSIAQTAIDVIIDDGFAVEGKEEIFEIVYEDEGNSDAAAINREVDTFLNEHNIYNMTFDSLEDLLLFGEQMNSQLVVKGDGIVEINDDVDLVSTLAMYKSGDISYFLAKQPRSIVIKKPYEIGHYTLASRKIKIKLDAREKTYNLRESMRVGRSVLYPALDKLKEIQLMDIASVATELRKSLMPLLLSIGVPSNTSPVDAKEVMREYERKLEDMFYSGEDFSSGVNATEKIMSMISKVKAFPSYADTKGSLERVDLRGEESSSSMEIMMDKRRMAALAIGLPPHYFAAEEQALGKTDLLKYYSRYSRKLMSIQKAVRDGLLRLIITHLTNKDYNFEPKKFKFTFKSLISTDKLDDMELLVTAITSVSEFYNFMAQIMDTEGSPIKVNPEAFVKVLQNQLSVIKDTEDLFMVDEVDDTDVEDPGFMDNLGELISSLPRSTQNEVKELMKKFRHKMVESEKIKENKK